MIYKLDHLLGNMFYRSIYCYRNATLVLIARWKVSNVVSIIENRSIEIV